jgi:hypothetical protein
MSGDTCDRVASGEVDPKPRAHAALVWIPGQLSGDSYTDERSIERRDLNALPLVKAIDVEDSWLSALR